jgi:hypothetical protein
MAADIEALEALLKQARSGESFELVVGRHFETDDGSFTLTQDQAVMVVRTLLADAAKTVS